MKHRIRKTTPTSDQDAQVLNRGFNDVDRYAQSGRELHELLHGRFEGDESEFNRWIRANLDRSATTISRYLAIFENIEMLTNAKVIRLKDAYKILGIAGANPTTNDSL